MIDVPHVVGVGDVPADVGDIPSFPRVREAGGNPDDEYGDLAVPHVSESSELESGGRLEPKWYNNKNGTRRLYYVIRFERRHADGRRYRPMRYIGITPPGSIALGDVPHISDHVPHAVPHARNSGAGSAREESGAAAQS